MRSARRQPRCGKRLGESLASVQKYDALPEDTTTSSLEALQAYALGNKATDIDNDYLAAIPFFQRAVALDPEFRHGLHDVSRILSTSRRTHAGR